MEIEALGRDIDLSEANTHPIAEQVLLVPEAVDGERYVSDGGAVDVRERPDRRVDPVAPTTRDENMERRARKPHQAGEVEVVCEPVQPIHRVRRLDSTRHVALVGDPEVQGRGDSQISQRLSETEPVVRHGFLFGVSLKIRSLVGSCMPAPGRIRAR